MRSTTLLSAGAGLIALLAVAACGRRESMSCATPPPPAGVDPLNAGDRGKILDYARTLTFEPDSSPTGEKRRLTQVHDSVITLGPTVAAAPARCSHANKPTDLVAGRIVGRMVADGPYPKLGLPRDTSYVWIDRFDAATGRARAVIIPANAADSVKVDSVRVEQHGPTYGRMFAEARWIFDPRDDVWWESCIMYGCCRVYGQE